MGFLSVEDSAILNCYPFVLHSASQNQSGSRSGESILLLCRKSFSHNHYIFNAVARFMVLMACILYLFSATKGAGMTFQDMVIRASKGVLTYAAAQQTDDSMLEEQGLTSIHSEVPLNVTISPAELESPMEGAANSNW